MNNVVELDNMNMKMMNKDKTKTKIVIFAGDRAIDMQVVCELVKKHVEFYY